MDKRTLDNLCIEITRKCNMQCAHCLRGEAENLDGSLEHVKTLLDRCNYICSITFTGGEPGLNVPMINAVLDLCKEREIEVGSFFVATNATVNQEALAIAALRWYAYCSEKEMCLIDHSNDIYHQVQPAYYHVDTSIFEGLSFFGTREVMDNLIGEGFASDNGLGNRPVSSDELEVDEYTVSGMIYLNAKGFVVTSGCDWSYRSQDDEVFCHVSEFWDEIELAVAEECYA